MHNEMVIIERLKGVEVRVDDLEAWQERQNGAIHRVEDAVNDIRRTLLSIMKGVLIAAVGAAGSLIVGIALYLMNR